MPPTIPDTVPVPLCRLYQAANDRRAEIKATAEQVNSLRTAGLPPEAGANATLAYRHLEDASMRLGKVLQALDGGVSVYDKSTTVDTPKAPEGGAA